MSITFKLNEQSHREFIQALRDYAATVTGKGADEIVNTASLVLCYKAAELTRHADPAEINALKFEKAVEIARQTKTGKLRFLKAPKPGRDVSKARKQYEVTPRGFLIYLKMQWQKGANPRRAGSRQVLLDRALRMVNARASSVNYLRSGWLAAAAHFEALLPRRPGGKPRVERKRKGMGSAEVSQNGRARAVIENNSLFQQKRLRAALVALGRDGLEKAVQFSKQKLREITEDRLRRAAEKFNHR